MSKTLFIHAGTPKTGSSFLQSIFNQNSHHLKKNGILYPGVSNGKYQICSNVDINGQVITRAVIYKTLEELLEIKNELTEMFISLFSMGMDKVFLSDETLGMVKPYVWEVINDICNSLGVNLIVFSYYRRPENYYASHWAQLVRNHGEVKSLIDFSMSTNLQVWRNILEIHEKVTSYAFSYEAEVKREEGLLFSASQILGVSVDIFIVDLENKNVNPSLSLNALTAIRVINDEFGSLEGNKLNKYLTNIEPISKKPKPAFDPTNQSLLRVKHCDEHEKCQKIYQNSLKKLNFVKT